MKQLEGTCLCGKVKIQTPDDFDYMGNCHCSECRKFSGSELRISRRNRLIKVQIYSW